ncbi:MAG: hypothetical protein WDO13_08135 [Verrucomicrobiota bacterium]
MSSEVGVEPSAGAFSSQTVNVRYWAAGRPFEVIRITAVIVFFVIASCRAKERCRRPSCRRRSEPVPPAMALRPWR